MATPLEITFRNVDRSPALEEHIKTHVERLEKFFDQIISCHVMVEMPHQNKHHGNLFHVRIDLAVPNGEIVAGRDPQNHHAHEDAYVAVRDAFRAATRQMQNYTQRRQLKVKRHVGAGPSLD